MGSFYSSCSITSMTLSHQKVVRFLLVPSMYFPYDGKNYDSRDGFKGKGLYVSNNGAVGMFSPFGFAIRGEYYDYGMLENVVRDKNVEKLEDFFGLTIEEIMECASDDRWYEHGIKRPAEAQAQLDAVKVKLAHHMENAQKLVPAEEWEVKRKELEAELEKVTKDTHYEIHVSPEHWKLKKEPKNLDILLKLTYTDIRAEVYDKIASYQPSGRSDWFSERRKKLIEEFFDNVKARNELKEKVDEESEALKKEGMSEEEMDKLRDSMLQIKFYLRDVNVKGFLRDSDINFLKLLDIDENLRTEYEELYNFIINLGALNKMFLPSIYGSQTDNFKFLSELNTFTNELLAVDMRRWEEDEDE